MLRQVSWNYFMNAKHASSPSQQWHSFPKTKTAALHHKSTQRLARASSSSLATTAKNYTHANVTHIQFNRNSYVTGTDHEGHAKIQQTEQNRQLEPEWRTTAKPSMERQGRPNTELTANGREERTALHQERHTPASTQTISQSYANH